MGRVKMTEEMIKQRLQELELIKSIAHAMIHRMTLWQLLTKGRFWRKEYDKACEKMAQIRDSRLSNYNGQ